jgi:hypothetical protein
LGRVEGVGSPFSAEAVSLIPFLVIREKTPDPLRLAPSTARGHLKAVLQTARGMLQRQLQRRAEQLQLALQTELMKIMFRGGLMLKQPVDIRFVAESFSNHLYGGFSMNLK